jgi:hypothetical protein
MEQLKQWGGKIGGAIVGLVVAALMIGGFFTSCVLPFINDSSETWTCNDAEVQGFCGDPETIGGFLAAICGRDEVEFKGNVIETVSLGGPGEQEPDTYEFEISCPGVALKWEFATLDEFNDEQALMKNLANDQTRLAVKLLEEYTYGEIDISTAQRLLVEE